MIHWGRNSSRAAAGLCIAAVGLVISVMPSQGAHRQFAAFQSTFTCGPVDKSKFTLVTPDDVYNGKITSTYVAIKGTIVLNEAGDYTDRHIQFKTAHWHGGFNGSLASESVQEYRWSFLPQANQNVIAYGVLRYDYYHQWYEMHPAYEYDLVGGGGGHATCTAPNPIPYDYTPQTVTQIATGQFPYPRTAVTGKVVKVNPPVNNVQSFVISDGRSQLLVEIPPENAFTPPAVGQTIKVLGIPRRTGVHSGPWELNPAFETTTHLANPPHIPPPED
jgi:hypothetical protein